MPKEHVNMRKLKNAAGIASIVAIVAIAAPLATTNPSDNAQAQTDSGICGRNATIQAAILAAIPSTSGCANVTDQQLAAIAGTLDLSDGTLTTQATSDLAGLSGVTALDLSGNDIDFLPSHVFDDLSALKEIDLSGNGMTTLPPDPFHHNHDLEVMDASDNDMTWLQEGIFLNNAALISVDLSDNSISHLSGTEFTNSPNIQKINLENNSLPGLNVGMFEGISNLSELKLAGNAGAPFTFDVRAFDLGDNAIEVLIGGGPAPFGVTASLSATNGNLSADSVSIPAGTSASAVLTVTRDGDHPATGTVSNAAFTNGTRTGVQISNGTPLAVAIDGEPRGICSRTREIQDAIMAQLGSVHCALVTDSQLSTITRPLAVVETGLTNLRTGDLAGLTGVRDLYLYGNELSELPENLFKDSGSFDRVLLQNNPGADFELTVNIESRENNQIVAVIREGTPFHTTMELSAIGGTLSERFIHVGPGSSQSDPVTTYASEADTPVVVTVESVEFRDWGLLAYSYYDAFVVKAGQHLDGTTTSGSAIPTRSGASAQSQPVATPEPTPEPEAPTVQEPTEPPSTPTNLTAAVNDDGSITLSWDTPDDDTITGYEILRRRPTEGERRLTTYVANTDTTDTTYTDANVTSGVRHVYRVKAINAAGVGPQSNYVRIEP